MSRAPINVHIEHLLVDGVPGIDRARLGDLVARELERQLSAERNAIPATLTPRIQAGTIQARPGQTTTLGKHIAHATLRAIGVKQ